MKYPIGFDKINGSKQIAVRLPASLFEHIVEMAKMEEKNFNEMIVELVNCGKLCLEESDALEIRQ